MAKLVPCKFGALPVDRLNAALDLELEEGDVVMSVNAQKHARKRHPNEFAKFFPHLASVIFNPLYAGDDFRNKGKIELIGKPLGAPDFLLVAVSLEQDSDGNYFIASFYPVSDKKVSNRRDSGHLLRVI